MDILSHSAVGFNPAGTLRSVTIAQPAACPTSAGVSESR